MTGSEYQKLAMRTCQFEPINHLDMLCHALFGLCSEVGEIHNLYQKEYQGHMFTVLDVRDELGDVLWMIAELCHAYDLDLDDVMEANIEKLKKRYPDGFDPERSIHRPEYENKGKD